LNAANLSLAALKQLMASVVTGLRNKATDLKEFVRVMRVRVMSNEGNE
jgi:hypothetical protein